MSRFFLNPKVYWGRSLLWLCLLGPFFFISYGYANHYAEQQGVTRSIYFAWEHYIPFVPWTIVPYWSLDLLYGLSFLACRSKLEVDRHALRLLTIQIIAVVCFLIYPLHFAFLRPHASGFFGAMFDALMGFDRPYNQAPSLHISLLVVVWVRFSYVLTSWWRRLTHVWMALIALSVLTTYQHHFIDIPTGLILGFFAMWLWPDQGLACYAYRRDAPKQYRLALCYAAAAVLLLGLFYLTMYYILLWPALSLSLVAMIYAYLGVAGFQKQQGQHSLAIQVLLAPYLWAAKLNAYWWTRRLVQPQPIMDGVYLGRLPNKTVLLSEQFKALYDLTAELPAAQGSWTYVNLPCLDLVPMSVQTLSEAAQQIEQLRRQQGKTLVCCALGFSRSAGAVVAWLLLTQRAQSLEQAEQLVRIKCPYIVLSTELRANLTRYLQQLSGRA